MDAIEPSNYEQAGWSDLTYEYVQALCTALDAEKARADAAEAALKTAREALAGMRAVLAKFKGYDEAEEAFGYDYARTIGAALAKLKGGAV